MSASELPKTACQSSIFALLAALLGGAACAGPAPAGPALSNHQPGPTDEQPTSLARSASTATTRRPQFRDRPPIVVAPYPDARPHSLSKTPTNLATGPAPSAPPAPPVAERGTLTKAIAVLEKELARASLRNDQFAIAMRIADQCERLGDLERAAGDQQASERAYTKAIDLYQRLVSTKDYATQKDMDSALFRMALSLQHMGNMSSSRQVFHRLIRDFPKSEYIPNSYLAFADYFFDNGQMENASRFYEKVALFVDSPVYGYALYKLAWVHMNLQDYQRALEGFYRLATNSALNRPADAALKREATKDLVIAYSHVGQPRKAYSFFQRVDRQLAPDLLDRLGTLYLDQGKQRAAIDVRRLQLEVQPRHPQACQRQHDVVYATMSLGARDAQLAELERLAQIRRQMADDGNIAVPVRAECDQTVRTLLGEVARTWHREQGATLQAPLRRPIMRVYALYVEHFPTSPYAAENQYYLADLSWREAMDQSAQAGELNAWHQAAMAFVAVLRMTSNPPGDALAATVQAYDNTLALARALGGQYTLIAADARSALEFVVKNHPDGPIADQARTILRTLP